MKRKPKTHPCKIGTHGSCVVILKHPYRPRKGLRMLVRYPEPGTKWFEVKVTAVRPDGFFFADL